jgi:glycogen debranching enzyme
MKKKHFNKKTDHLLAVGREKAIELLHRCVSDHGFMATPVKRDNYSRIWGRDSSIMGLAAVLTRDEELIEGCRRSLLTLAEYQGPHGEIPSNVDPDTERVSYGGTTGRIDSNLWFLITCGELCPVLQDHSLLEQLLPAVERTRKLLGAWEFNNRGLLYIPPTGDWADEYLQSGYVLYDQLLYYQALRAVCRLHQMHHQTEDHTLREKAVRLKHLIRANYWLDGEGEVPDDVYHPVLYKKGRKALPNQPGQYWLPYFSPLGYGYRFDAMANVLTLLLDMGSPEQENALIAHIDENICTDHDALIPAFCPIITPRDERWDDLKMTFSYEFKNKPYEYHNGGLWPMVNGFYAAGLARSGRTEKAKRILEAVHGANRQSMHDERDGEDKPWSFPEFLNGKTGKPGGVAFMGWSAAGALIADACLHGKQVFNSGNRET